MIYPANVQLTFEVGGSFDGVIALFTDQAQTVPLNLSTFTSATLQINKPTASPEATFTTANGLVLGGSSGTITITLTALQLAAFTAAQSVPYAISVIDASNHTYFVVAGTAVFASPLG